MALVCRYVYVCVSVYNSGYVFMPVYIHTHTKTRTEIIQHKDGSYTIYISMHIHHMYKTASLNLGVSKHQERRSCYF
jgi:hypothetical protein